MLSVCATLSLLCGGLLGAVSGQTTGPIDYSTAVCTPVVGDINPDDFPNTETGGPLGGFGPVPASSIILVPFYTFPGTPNALLSPVQTNTLQTTLDDNTGAVSGFLPSGIVAMRLGIFTQTNGGDPTTDPVTQPSFQLLMQSEEVVLDNPVAGIYNASLINAVGGFATFTAEPDQQYFLAEWFNVSVNQDFSSVQSAFGTNSSMYPYSSSGFPTGTIFANLTGTGGYNAVGGYYFDQPILLSNCVPAAVGTVSGDPQFSGLLGQSYQIHGIDGAHYNLITSASTQVNARFLFLHSGVCPPVPSPTNCWSHPGSYLGAVGIMELVDGEVQKLSLVAGAASVGFEGVTLNGDEMSVGTSITVGQLTVTYVDSYRVTVSTAQFSFVFDNSDRFINQQVSSLTRLSQLTTHGLLGQTHHMRHYNTPVKYIEGGVDDYVLGEDSLWGVNFPYNQFQQ